MRISKRLTLAALAAVVVLSLAAGPATAARSLSFSESVITLLARELSFTSAGLGVSLVCEVGFTVTLAKRAIAKTERAEIERAEAKVLGQETGAERCREGRARVLTGPFSVEYLSFTGTLPSILGLLRRIKHFLFLIEIAGLARCLISANISETLRVREGRLESMTGNPFRLEEVIVTRLAGSVFCPSTTELQLRGTLTTVRTATVTLI